MLSFSLYGRWDELDEIDTAFNLLGHLHEVSIGVYMVKDLNLPADAPGNLADDQGNPFENFGALQRMYEPLGLSGTYTVRGLDTAANSYPSMEEVCIDKQGNPITIELTLSMSPFDIMGAVVALTDTLFDGFPHHCYFEGLDVDPVAHTLTFSMGS